MEKAQKRNKKGRSKQKTRRRDFLTEASTMTGGMRTNDRSAHPRKVFARETRLDTSAGLVVRDCRLPRQSKRTAATCLRPYRSGPPNAFRFGCWVAYARVIL